MRKACRKCKQIFDADICPNCKEPTTQYWSGYLAVINPEKSEIAKRMNIKIPGEYVLKIR
ncbi:MAG: transcription elongation factor subunit Spt4 [Candidatus Altiarchaeota archaeon]